MDLPLCSLLRSHPGLAEEDRTNEFMFGLVMEALPSSELAISSGEGWKLLEWFTQEKKVN